MTVNNTLNDAILINNEIIMDSVMIDVEMLYKCQVSTYITAMQCAL